MDKNKNRSRKMTLEIVLCMAMENEYAQFHVQFKIRKSSLNEMILYLTRVQYTVQKSSLLFLYDIWTVPIVCVLSFCTELFYSIENISECTELYQVFSSSHIALCDARIKCKHFMEIIWGIERLQKCVVLSIIRAIRHGLSE